MDAGPGNIKLNPGGSGVLALSLLSLSPNNSSSGESSPKTPEYTNRIGLNFGARVGVGMTPTPPPSVEGPAIFSGDGCQTMRSNTFPVASTVALDFQDHLHHSAGSIWSSRNVSQGGSHLSHIWANRQATPPHIVPQAGSIINHDYPHAFPMGFLGPHNPRDSPTPADQIALKRNFQPSSSERGLAPPRPLQTSHLYDKAPRNRDLTGHLPFASNLTLMNSPSSYSGMTEAQGQNNAGFASIRTLHQARQPFENAERTLVPVSNHDFYHHHHHHQQQQQQQQQQKHSFHRLPPHPYHALQPLKDAVLELQENQTVQDLGVDILRISPPSVNHYPADRFPHSPFSLSHRHTIPIASSSSFEDSIRQPILPPPPPPLPLTSFAGPLAPHIINTNHSNTGFTPMHAVNEQTRGSFHPLDVVSSSRPMSNRFSTRYHGMHTEANASAEHIAPEQNCALWLTNLPPDVTPKQLLGAIRKVGRIWCSFINYPDNVSHHTAAAKVVFFTPKATQQFLSDSWTKGLYLMGSNNNNNNQHHRVRVAHNRIKSESKEDELQTPKSRVLIITGRAEFVNETYLTKYFKDRFIFQNDDVTELINAGGRAVLEWKFGSYRCQAQMGKMSLEKDRPYWLEKVEFGEDPCEVGDTFSSYGIAAERIQGRGL